MSDTATRPPKAPPRPAAKELRALQKRMKQGYRFDRTGGGHWRVLDRHGQLVEHEGRNITTSGNPSPGVLRALEVQLREAGVLQGTASRMPPGAAKKQADSLRAMVEARSVRRQEEATALRERLAAALSFTALDQPQLASDLGAVGAIVAREQGKPLTPDLLTSSARRVLNGAWVEPRYQEVWQALCTRLEQAADSVGEWYLLIRQAKGLDADRVQVRTPAKSDWPFTVELLPLEALTVDSTYQRPPSWPFVRREAARFDASLVGTIDVAQRGPSSFAVLDGQQRVEIVRLQGIGSIYGSVYQGLDKASEARFFLHKNRDRKNVHPYHLLMARVTAEDTDAMAVLGTMKRAGYRPATGAPRGTDRQDNISAIAAVEIAYSRKLPDGSTALQPTLEVLRQAAHGRPLGTAGLLIRGISRALADEAADTEMLIRVVLEVGPELLLGPRPRPLSPQWRQRREGDGRGAHERAPEAGAEGSRMRRISLYVTVGGRRYHDAAILVGDQEPQAAVVEAVVESLSTEVEVEVGGVRMHLAAWADPEHWSEDWEAAGVEDVDALLTSAIEEQP